MSTTKRDITLRELSDMKYDAEFRIMETINKEIRKIRLQTGVSVQSVLVDLVNTQPEAKQRDFAVSNVDLELDLKGEN